MTQVSATWNSKQWTTVILFCMWHLAQHVTPVSFLLEAETWQRHEPGVHYQVTYLLEELFAASLLGEFYKKGCSILSASVFNWDDLLKFYFKIVFTFPGNRFCLIASLQPSLRTKRPARPLFPRGGHRRGPDSSLQGLAPSSTHWLLLRSCITSHHFVLVLLLINQQ